MRPLGIGALRAGLGDDEKCPTGHEGQAQSEQIMLKSHGLTVPVKP